MPYEECVEIGLALTNALAHLHQNGLVHRDVKPSNIIFVNGVPKLADLGYFRGFVHLGLGEKDKALDCLELAYAERFGWMANLKAEPEWDALRAEPRFIVLLRKMGSDPEWPSQ